MFQDLLGFRSSTSLPAPGQFPNLLGIGRSLLLSIICTDLSNRPFWFFPKSIQVVDWDRLARSFLFEAAPKVQKNRFQYSATVHQHKVASGVRVFFSGLK
jgi:hypothetical protein